MCKRHRHPCKCRSAPALSAAASATALVSEPPRPSVAMRLSALTPWKPATTPTSPSFTRLSSALALDAVDARHAVAAVRDERDLPALPGTGRDAHGLQNNRHEPGGDLLAGRDHGIVFPRVVLRTGFARPGDELVGVPGHGGHDNRDPVARIHLALHMPRGITDTFDIGDGRSAKLHDEEHLCSYAGKSGVKKPDLAALASPGKQEGHRWRLRQKHGEVHPWTKKSCGVLNAGQRMVGRAGHDFARCMRSTRRGLPL